MLERVRQRWNDWLDAPSTTAQWLLKNKHVVFYTASGVLVIERGIGGLAEAVILWMIYVNTIRE